MTAGILRKRSPGIENLWGGTLFDPKGTLISTAAVLKESKNGCLSSAAVGMVITINDVLVRTLYVFSLYLFVSEAVLPHVLRRELAVVFLCHLSLSPQRVITEVSSFYIHSLYYCKLILPCSFAIFHR
jgi:hypothetical protein